MKVFDISLNWVKVCNFKFLIRAKSPFVNSWNPTGILPIPLNARSILLACLLKPFLVRVSAQAKNSVCKIVLILGLIAIADCSSISLPASVGKSLPASYTTSSSILSKVRCKVW